MILATFLDVVLGTGQFILVTAASFVLLAGLASYLRFQHITARAAGATGEAVDPDDAMQLEIAHRVGTGHREPDPFSVLLVSAARLDDAGHENAGQAAGLYQQVTRRMQACIRGTDAFVPVDEERIGVVIDAGRQHLDAILKRLVQHLQQEPFRTDTGQAVRASARFGIATFPENGERVGVLLDAARRALADAGAKPPGGSVLAAPAAGETDVEPGDPAAAGAARDQKSLVDPLTGVLRSERVGGAVQKYVARFRKDDLPVSLVCLDVDHLARYNDHYGHKAGDEILRGLGAVLQTAVREEDLIGRYDGEEFLLVLSCSPAQALHAAQRVAAVVKRTPFRSDTATMKITVCQGVAGFPDHGAMPSRLFDAAFTALHAAKAIGRGSCALYDAAMPKPKDMQETVDRF